jgi:hypothetical protein
LVPNTGLHSELLPQKKKRKEKKERKEDSKQSMILKKSYKVGHDD